MRQFGRGVSFAFYLALWCTFGCTSFPVCAQDEPLELTAEESLEWRRNDLYFLAKKNVKVTQGAMVLYCDELGAKYRESTKSNIDIYHLKAHGNVRIVSADSKAYGDDAIYNMDKAYAEMIGKNLRFISPDQNVRAQDKFVYWMDKGRLEAVGHAVALRDGNKIKTDKLVAMFQEDKAGKRGLKSLEALGAVVITTPDEVLSGDYGFYSVETDLATLKGHVRITKGENVLEGARAQVNLKTNVSKLLGAAVDAGQEGSVSSSGAAKEQGAGRVRAVFYPGSKALPLSGE